MATVVILVILRLSVGCHFFYEGVWKIKHADEFSSEPFLTQAKGPFAPMFYAMVPDLDGKKRLKIEKIARADDGLVARWQKYQSDAETRFRTQLDKAGKLKDEAERKKLRDFTQASRRLLWDTEDKLDSLIARQEKALIEYFASDDKEKPAEQAKDWMAEFATTENAFLDALGKLIEESTGAESPSFNKGVPGGTDAAALSKVVSVRNGIKGGQALDTWSQVKTDIAKKYRLSDDQRYELEKVFRRYKDSLKQYLAENLADIAAYHGSRTRFEQRRAEGNNGADHQKKRTWDEQQKLRREVGQWLGEIDQLQDDFGSAAWALLSDAQKRRGDIPMPSTRGDFVDFMVTYGLTAIGFCLLLGLFTRPAALGGAAFLTFVLMTQPPWPTIYPPAPGVVGHALLVDKNFIELVALLLIASCAAGRWAGVDYFVEHYVLEGLRKCGLKCCCCCTNTDPATADTSEQSEKSEQNPETEKEGA